MAGIRVVTDSAGDLDQTMVSEHGIAIVDLDVRLGDIGPDVTRTWSAEEFWRQCAKHSELPETSAPAPGAFVEAFEQAADATADGVVCITLSSKLSATYQAAVAGAKEVVDRIDVRVIDSLAVTMGEGLLVLEAAAMAAEGASLDTIQQAIERSRANLRIYAAFDTLENLRKGGRIGGAQAFIGSLLSIKPIIELRDGAVEAESKQRTRMRSLEYLANKVKEAGPIKQLVVVHAAAPDVDSLVDLVATTVPREAIRVTFVGPVIGTHAGPGTVGVCFELA